MIFLVGHHAAGKTEIANVLKSNFGFLHVETSGVVKGYKRETAPELPMDEWATSIEANYGKDFFDKLIVDHVRRDISFRRQSNIPFQEVVVTGNRSPHGVRYVVDHMQDFLSESTFEPRIIAVHADVPTLYDRYVLRNRDKGDALLVQSAFEAILNKEKQSGLDKLMAESHHSFINNGSDRSLLVVEVTSVFSALGYQYYQDQVHG